MTRLIVSHVKATIGRAGEVQRLLAGVRVINRVEIAPPTTGVQKPFQEVRFDHTPSVPFRLPDDIAAAIKPLTIDNGRIHTR